MKIYLDLLFFLNFGFDFILLLVVSIILRRNVSLTRIVLGGLIGGLSIFILFLKINSFELFILKILISIIMILASFSYKNIKYFMKNFFFLYSASMILGGFLYFLNVQFSYKQEGLVFYHDGLSINFIFLLIFSPLILYIYIRQGLTLKNNFSNYYKVNLYFNNKKIRLNGFFLVPMKTVGGESFIKCFKIDELEIVGIGKKKNVLLGVTKTKIEMEGIDCILHQSLLEG